MPEASNKGTQLLTLTLPLIATCTLLRIPRLLKYTSDIRYSRHSALEFHVQSALGVTGSVIFDELADRRRKASARRMQEELIGLQEFLVQLLGVLREGNNAEVQYLVNAIRSGTSTQDIDLAIRRLLAYNPSLRFTRQMNS